MRKRERLFCIETMNCFWKGNNNPEKKIKNVSKVANYVVRYYCGEVCLGFYLKIRVLMVKRAQCMGGYKFG